MDPYCTKNKRIIKKSTEMLQCSKKLKKKVIENMRKERDCNRRPGRFQKKQYELEKKKNKTLNGQIKYQISYR